MASDSDYEDTDEELAVSTTPAAPPQKTPAKKTSRNEGLEPDYRWLFTNEEYDTFLLKSEKEREVEIFQRLEEEEDRKNREEIVKSLEEREEQKIVKSHTEGHKAYNDDFSSDEEFRRGVLKKKKKTEKSPSKAKKAATLNTRDVFGDDVGSSSSSDDSSDEGSSKSRSSSPDSSRRNSSDDEDGVPKKVVESQEDLRKARITRTQLSKFVHAPFFNDVVKGSFVQIRVGKIRQSQNDSIICQVLSVEQTAKTYDLEKTRTNKGVRIKYGEHEHVYRLNYVSNAEWSPAGYEEWKKTTNTVPTVDQVEKKRKEILGALNHTYTDKEIDLMVKEKKRFFKDHMNPVARKSQLLNDLKFATQNSNKDEVLRIQKKLEDFEKQRLREEQASSTPVRKDWMEQLINQNNNRRISDMNSDKPFSPFSPKLSLNKHDGDDPFTRKREHTRVVCGQAKGFPKAMKRKAGSPTPQEKKPLQPAPHNKQLSFTEDPFALYATMKFDIDFNNLDDAVPKPPQPTLVDPEKDQYKMQKLAKSSLPEFNDLL